MRHLKSIQNNVFYKEPMEFNKYTESELLRYALGSNLYMNGLMDIYTKITTKALRDIGTITICFEDAIRERDLETCEEKVLNLLEDLHKDFINEKLEEEYMPLIFIRVRNVKQFVNFTERLSNVHMRFITGFTFPKFNLENGFLYLEHLTYLNKKHNDIIYGMPILETEAIIYKESRVRELIQLKQLMDKFQNLILNIRVGGTDFSSKFGLRRNVNFNIYDIKIVSDCLIDIINFFSRREVNYAISAPVWEYFSLDYNSKEVMGLIKEVQLDKENGFYGKTVIHPTQGKYVNALYAVEYEDYVDARNIIEDSGDGGVFKGCGENKMNEVLPHLSWAKKVNYRALVFGVLKEGITYSDILKG